MPPRSGATAGSASPRLFDYVRRPRGADPGGYPTSVFRYRTTRAKGKREHALSRPLATAASTKTTCAPVFLLRVAADYFDRRPRRPNPTAAKPIIARAEGSGTAV